MKAKFEQQAFFRQISKRLYNFHACGATVGSGSAISAIKNHTGENSFEVGKKYGRGYVSFDAVNLSISGNTADLVVTASRYDKKKQQTVGSIKKTYPLTLVRGPSSIEGCYLNTTNAVTKSNKDICNGIEGASWNGSSCELTSPFNKKCPTGEALDEIAGNGDFRCCDVQWKPHPNQWCDGINFRQKTGCEGKRTATGTKTPNIWTPTPSTICHGRTFSQTETCCRGFTSCAPNTKTETGTKCDSSCFTPPCPHGASINGGVCACNPAPPPNAPPGGGTRCCQNKNITVNGSTYTDCFSFSPGSPSGGMVCIYDFNAKKHCDSMVNCPSGHRVQRNPSGCICACNNHNSYSSFNTAICPYGSSLCAGIFGNHCSAFSACGTTSPFCP